MELGPPIQCVRPPLVPSILGYITFIMYVESRKLRQY